MMRIALSSAAVLAGLTVGVGSAGATNECKGLQVCVRVPGPWVVVPATRTTPRIPVQYQLSCPRGFTIGGLDAELSVRPIDVDFSGLLGSPVNPGVTTTRAALFRAVYTGAAAATPTFRPHLGCIPAAGGGGGPVPFRAPDAFPPGQPTVRRVHNVRLHVGVTRAVAACAPGERLISGWHALGFETANAPTAALVSSVSAAQRIRGNHVVVRVRGGAELGTTRGVAQVGAVCGGGS
jgi:hypothetical protein